MSEIPQIKGVSNLTNYNAEEVPKIFPNVNRTNCKPEDDVETITPSSILSSDEMGHITTSSNGNIEMSSSDMSVLS